MKLVRYLFQGQEKTGFLEYGFVVELAAALEEAGATDGVLQQAQILPVESLVMDQALMDDIRDLTSRLGMPGSCATPLWEVDFLPPVTRPGKVICVGLNYPPADRSGFVPPEYPVLFHKTASALTGMNRPIVMPEISREVEYEGELAIVIGRRAKQVRWSEAPQVIAGYTIANDVGARDVQHRSSQWTSGKMFDTFCPLGPALVTKDDVPAPGNLRITTWVNEEIVQDGSTAQMIFDPWTIVSSISELTTLLPGDVILTGSPKTVGDEPDPRRLLWPGDEVSIEIESLGRLRNPVIKEARKHG